MDGDRAEGYPSAEAALAEVPLLQVELGRLATLGRVYVWGFEGFGAMVKVADHPHVEDGECDYCSGVDGFCPWCVDIPDRIFCACRGFRSEYCPLCRGTRARLRYGPRRTEAMARIEVAAAVATERERQHEAQKRAGGR